jgi:hypothetical protein
MKVRNVNEFSTQGPLADFLQASRQWASGGCDPHTSDRKKKTIPGAFQLPTC